MDIDYAITIVVILAAVVYLVIRQLQPRLLSRRELVLLPLVLAFFLARSLVSSPITDQEIIHVVAFGGLGIVFGLLSCTALRLSSDPATGVAVVSGTWAYLLWWILAFVARLGMLVVLNLIAGSPLNTIGSTASILASACGLLVVRSLYLGLRAAALDLPLARGSVHRSRRWG
jgi:hypothetical protein